MRKLLEVILFICLAAGFSYSQNTAVNKDFNYISKIKISGLLNSYGEDLKFKIPLKENTQVNPLDFQDLLNESVKQLYALDVCKTVNTEVSGDKTNLTVNFIIEENPYIRLTKYVGNNSIRKDDLDKVIDFNPSGSYFTTSKLNHSLVAIRNKHIESGFIEATVSYRLEIVDVKKNIYNIVFVVNEAKKIVVEKINVTGNKLIAVGDIKGPMKTKEQFFIFNSGVLKKEDFDLDRETIITLYQRKGLLDAQLVRYEWKIEELGNDKHKGIVVYIDIKEGPRYYAGKTTITGNNIYTTNELYPLVTMAPGEIYDKAKMDMIRFLIFNKYSDNGHVYANITPVLTTNTNYIVDTELVIYEGPRAHIENITVSGNTKTKEYVIKRELILKEGELYIQRKVRQTYEKLMQLQYFSDVKVGQNFGSAEGLIGIDMEVVEQRTGMVSVGFGYGTETGWNIGGQVAERNLFGTGRSATIKGTLGQTSQSIGIDYTEPWIFGEPNFLTVSLGFSRYMYQNIPADSDAQRRIDGTSLYFLDNPTNTGLVTNGNFYYRDNVTLGATLARNLWIYWSGFVGLGTTMYKDWGANFNSPLIYTGVWETNTSLIDSLKRSWTFKNYLTLGVNENSTDHPLAPTYGNKFSLSVTSFGGILGGDVHFIKNRESFDQYWNPLWKFVFAFHASTDFMFPQFGAKNGIYDYSDMLYFDGMYEMRGWTGYPRRGESKLFASAEFRFPLFVNELWWAFFYDIGNVWNKYNEFSPVTPDGYLYSFGAGLQLNIAMLPIRIYMARLGYYDSTIGQWTLYGSKEFWAYWMPVVSIQGLF